MTHDTHSAGEQTVRCAVVTVSDTRTERTDESGRLARRLIEEAGHIVVAATLVADEHDAVRALVRDLQARVDVTITTGGTGISGRDTTYEAIEGLLTQRLDGFGELFRMLSFAEVGAHAMLSRACAGLIGKMALFCLPGSPKAVRLGLDKLILPVLPHLVAEVRK